MLIELTATYRRARVWLDELPEIPCDGRAIRDRSIRATGGTPVTTTEAALEVVIPTGGRALYGLLGGTFQPSVSGNVAIEVVTCTPRRGVQWALVSRYDEVRSGLSPGEYVEYILEGAVSTIVELGMGSGRLQFGHALIGGAGSGPIVFRWLAQTLTRLFVAERTANPTDDVARVIDLDHVVPGRW